MKKLRKVYAIALAFLLVMSTLSQAGLAYADVIVEEESEISQNASKIETVQNEDPDFEETDEGSSLEREDKDTAPDNIDKDDEKTTNENPVNDANSKEAGEATENTNSEEQVVGTEENANAPPEEKENVVVSNDTTETTISQSYSNKNSDGSDKTKYYSDEDMIHEVKLTVSGNVTSLTNHVVRIEIPNEHLGGFELTKPEQASTVEYVTEGDKRVAYITFPQLAGGTELTIPVRTKFKYQTTPETYKLDIKTTFLDSDKQLVKESNPIQFEAKYDKPDFQKRLNGKGTNGQKIIAGMSDENGYIIEGQVVEIPFDFFMSDSSLEGAKSREIEKITIVDTLPPYAHFDPTLNPGWVLNTDGKTVSKTFEGNHRSLRIAINAEKLRLTFPGAKLDEYYTNKAQVTFEQSNKEDYEEPIVLEDDIEYVFDAKSIGNFFGKNAPGNSNIVDSENGKAKLQQWSIIISNPTGLELQNIVIDDFKNEDQMALDERMVFDHIDIHSSYFKDSNVKVFAIVGENETEVEIVKDEEGKFPLPDNTKGIKVKVDKLAPYTGSQYIRVYTKLKDPSSIHYDSETLANNKFENTATVNANLGLKDNPDVTMPVSATDKDNYRLVQLNEKVSLTKSIPNVKPVYLEGDTIQFNLIFSPSSDVEPDRVFKNAKFIDLLPKGITPVPRSEYTIVENFKNTGRTAVIFDRGDLMGNSRSRATVLATVNKLSDEGYNTNEAFFVYDGEQLPISGDSIADEYDFNDNGNTEELINYAKVDYNYLPAKEVVARKYIKNKELNNWSTEGVNTAEEGEFEYRLNVKNYLDSNVEKLTLYDVLPYNGDKAIVKSDEGSRADRESNFSNTLTGPVVAPEGFTVYYSTDSIIEDEVEAVNNGNWQQTIADYSKVTAIKVVMNEGTILASKAEVNITVPMKAPKKWELDSTDKAYNSFAASTNNGQSFVEGNKVYNQMDVTRITKDVNGEEHVSIDREKEYVYNVVTQLPEDIKDYKKFVITDEVDPNLIINVEGIKATVDGVSYEGLTVNVDGNTIKVEVIDFLGLDGKKQIELVIPAKISEDTDMSEYEDNKIPNTASIDFTNGTDEEGEKETDPVTVTPKDPGIIKDVNGKEHLNINREKEYNYNVVTMLPKDIKEYTKFIITDDVDAGLTVNKDGVKVTVDGVAYEGLTLTVEGNKITVTVTDFTGLDGKKQIELVIPAKINKNTDMSKYTDNKIPNTAKLDFTNVAGDEKSKETKPVTVTPNKPGEPDKPGEPNKPEKPGKPGEPSKSGEPSKPSKPVNPTPDFEDKLPQTGEEQFMYMMILGFLFLTLGGVLVLRRKKGVQ